MGKKIGKNKWALFLFALVGIVLGSYLAFLSREVSWLKWLNYGLDFAIGNPTTGNHLNLDLAVIVISFGVKVKISIGSIFGIIAAIFIYNKI